MKERENSIGKEIIKTYLLAILFRYSDSNSTLSVSTSISFSALFISSLTTLARSDSLRTSTSDNELT